MKVKSMNRWVSAAIAAAGCCCLTSEAWAYRVLEKDGVPVGWAKGTQLTFELTEDFPEGVPAEAVRSQIASAMQLWNAQAGCKAPPLSLTGSGTFPLSGDGKNTIAWVFSNWVSSTNAAETAPGVTDLRVGQDEAGQYQIHEADLYLNAEHFHWTTERGSAGLTPAQQVQYLKEVVAHELGHALGMDHPCETDQPNIPDCASGTSFSKALMFPNPKYVEPALDEDDASGLCDLYRQSGSCAADDPACGTQSAAAVGSSNFTSPVLEGGKCKRQADCATFLACRDGKCEFGTLAPGDLCDVNAQCVTGACINGGCRANCTEDEPCGYAHQQCDAATSTCGNRLRTIGGKCDEADDCASAQCLVDSGFASYCTKECIVNEECPSGWSCSEMNGLDVCLQTRQSNDGCTLTHVPGSNGWSGTALLLAIGLMGLWIRREKTTGED